MHSQKIPVVNTIFARNMEPAAILIKEIMPDIEIFLCPKNFELSRQAIQQSAKNINAFVIPAPKAQGSFHDLLLENKQALIKEVLNSSIEQASKKTVLGR